jgi:hypothetical protein
LDQEIEKAANALTKGYAVIIKIIYVHNINKISSFKVAVYGLGCLLNRYHTANNICEREREKGRRLNKISQ